MEAKQLHDKYSYRSVLIDLARNMHAESRFADDPFDEVHVYYAVMAPAHRVVGLFSAAGQLVGGALLFVTSPFWAGSVKVLSDFAVYIHPQHRSIRSFTLLINEIERLAAELGCNRIELGITAPTNPERTAALYRRRGYTPSGTLCVKDVSNVLLRTEAAA